MTTEQKQCLLYYLGFYKGDIDGEWGPQSRSATLDFQNAYGLTPDGAFGNDTANKILAVIASGEKPKVSDDPWDNIKYFTKEEFKCKCGGKYCSGYPAEIDMDMVRIADAIRGHIGKPLHVNSGLRCRTHNANEGGVSDSQHLFGKAADLGIPNGVTSKQMAAIAADIMGDTGGIGIYYWGIHIDTRKTKSRWNG